MVSSRLRGGRCEKCVSRVLDVQFFIVVVAVITMLQVISRPCLRAAGMQFSY